jgi:hypothetical protein
MASERDIQADAEVQAEAAVVELSIAPVGIMGKFVYIGERFPRGPYRGLTAQAVVDGREFTSDEDQEDFAANLKAW